MREASFGWHTWVWAKLQNERRGSPAYVYYMDQRPPYPADSRNADVAGVPHGAELPYVFQKLELTPLPWTDADRRISDAMATYWTNFAKTGQSEWRRPAALAGVHHPGSAAHGIQGHAAGESPTTTSHSSKPWMPTSRGAAPRKARSSASMAATPTHRRWGFADSGASVGHAGEAAGLVDVALAVVTRPARVLAQRARESHLAGAGIHACSPRACPAPCPLPPIASSPPADRRCRRPRRRRNARRRVRCTAASWRARSARPWPSTTSAQVRMVSRCERMGSSAPCHTSSLRPSRRYCARPLTDALNW